MNCRICSKVIDFDYFHKEQLEKRQLCVTCDFWWDKVEMRANGDLCEGNRVARVRYNHYIIYPDNPSGPQGFGGRPHTIKFEDGEEVVTCNLWHQGEIPKWFRAQLPNNATFVDTRLTCSCRTKFEPIASTQTKCMTCVLEMKPQRW